MQELDIHWSRLLLAEHLILLMILICTDGTAVMSSLDFSWAGDPQFLKKDSTEMSGMKSRYTRCALLPDYSYGWKQCVTALTMVVRRFQGLSNSKHKSSNTSAP